MLHNAFDAKKKRRKKRVNKTISWWSEVAFGSRHPPVFKVQCGETKSFVNAGAFDKEGQQDFVDTF